MDTIDLDLWAHSCDRQQHPSFKVDFYIFAHVIYCNTVPRAPTEVNAALVVDQGCCREKVKRGAVL